MDWENFLTITVGCAVAGLIGWFVVDANFNPEKIAKRRAENVIRCTPKVMVRQKDVTLYRLEANCQGNQYEVYYSKQGTSWTRTETRRSGKTVHTVHYPMQVVNN